MTWREVEVPAAPALTKIGPQPLTRRQQAQFAAERQARMLNQTAAMALARRQRSERAEADRGDGLLDGTDFARLLYLLSRLNDPQARLDDQARTDLNRLLYALLVDGRATLPRRVR